MIYLPEEAKTTDAYAWYGSRRITLGGSATFDFLGFTHFCTRSRKWGSFVIGRKTIKKRMRAKLLAIKIELRRIMHDPIAKTGAWVKTDAERASELLRCLGQPPEPVVVLQQGEAALARVAQAAQPNGTPQLGEVHPFVAASFRQSERYTAALSPLRRQNPREEPGALAAHAGICTGGGWQRPVPTVDICEGLQLTHCLSDREMRRANLFVNGNVGMYLALAAMTND